MAKRFKHETDTLKKTSYCTHGMSHPYSLRNTCKSLQEDSLSDATCLALNNLPDDVLIMIFKLLGVEDLIFSVPFVCRRWQVLSQVNILWKNKVYEPSDDTPLNHIVKVLKNAPKLQILSVSENYHITPGIFDTLASRAREIMELSKESRFRNLHDKWKARPGCTSQEQEYATLRSQVKTRLVLNYYLLHSLTINRKKKS